MKKLDQITIMNTEIYGVEFYFYRGTKTYRFVPKSETSKHKMFRAIGNINLRDVFKMVYMSSTQIVFERK